MMRVLKRYWGGLLYLGFLAGGVLWIMPRIAADLGSAPLRLAEEAGVKASVRVGDRGQAEDVPAGVVRVQVSAASEDGGRWVTVTLSEELMARYGRCREVSLTVGVEKSRGRRMHWREELAGGERVLMGEVALAPELRRDAQGRPMAYVSLEF